MTNESEEVRTPEESKETSNENDEANTSVSRSNEFAIF